jgi:exonuclease III
LSVPYPGHRILCGDFNLPRREFPDGSIETFASNHPGEFELWDEAERLLLEGLREWDLEDVFRKLHGYGRFDVSWSRASGRGAGHRLDHILASSSLNAIWCDYQHGWREAGFSDHSGMEAIFGPAGAG